ncbi:MAG TPA: class I SAM-dependent rRNA methyltransferase [Polyangiaceae bacterium]|nr:class I SAM-dependent rRNA methyltransferase [Polyangiaceae bacterium]
MSRSLVRLKKDLARSIRRGHPWVYRDALAPAPELEDGAVVEVCGKDGRFLAVGFWDGRSPIAVRVLATEREFEPGRGIAERLAAAATLRLLRLDLEQTNAFRWVHGEADRLPGVHVDVYGDVASVRFDGSGARAFYGDLAALLRAEPRVGVKRVIDREMRSGAEEPLEVRENGLIFVVDLAHGQKGGLFLDQRENRAEVGKRARGRRVLNLFGYTGGFSLYAAAGGATRTDTVDQARPAIAAARHNFERNGFSVAEDRAGFHAVDAFDFLERARRDGVRYDLVISDPPSFAKNRAGLPLALKAYRRLHTLAASVVAPGGLLFAASCSSQVGRAEFVASVEAGARAAGRHFTLEAVRGAAFDHPVVPAFPEGEYLKLAIGVVS